MQSTLPPNRTSGLPIRAILSLFKLRIGVVITFTALAGLAVSPGASLTWMQLIVLTPVSYTHLTLPTTYSV